MPPIRHSEELDTLTLSAVALYTVGGVQSVPDLSDVTVTAQISGRELTILRNISDNPYETYVHNTHTHTHTHTYYPSLLIMSRHSLAILP